jgi:hypothetical protein
MTGEWAPPRCSHGWIILGCPDDDCPEQTVYLMEDNWRREATQEDRAADTRAPNSDEIGGLRW